MLRLTMTITATACAATLVGVQSAAAAGCPSITYAVSVGTITDFSKQTPDGVPLEGRILPRQNHFFEATSKVTLSVKGNELTLTKGTIFRTGCYATAKNEPLWPALPLLRGVINLGTSGSHPAGVITEEGLFDPRTSADRQFRVSRTLTSKRPLTLTDKLAWFANTVSQPRGTTDTSSQTNGAIVGVTPYVGRNPGSCRYVKSARLTTVGRPGKGTATYVK